jgi:hypothetical protein
MKPTPVLRNLGMVLAVALLAPAAHAAPADEALAEESLPPHLRDRGPGLPTSQFGVYVRRGELLVYPAFEYYKDKDFEYDPFEFGFESATEFKGRYRASEEVLFLAYGLSDRFALEFEGDLIQASLEKADEDLSGMPAERKESGLGDVRTRLTWRWKEESGRRPELFSYTEVFFPHDKKKPLVGTADWVFHGGIGAIRGFRWGTLTLRGGLLFEEASASATDWGEVALEYLKRVSPRATLFSSLLVREGDEISLITELQWHLSRNVVLRLNNGLGLTSHGNDWEPEVGILFKMPR